jgi:RNAse (barnase) inhibitor barstar
MRTIRLDTADLADKREVLTRFGEAFGFPEYYGRNLDALADCLAELTEPTALEWTGWQTLQAADPSAFGRITLVLDDRAEQAPAFAVWLLETD